MNGRRKVLTFWVLSGANTCDQIEPERVRFATRRVAQTFDFGRRPAEPSDVYIVVINMIIIAYIVLDMTNQHYDINNLVATVY